MIDLLFIYLLQQKIKIIYYQYLFNNNFWYKIYKLKLIFFYKYFYIKSIAVNPSFKGYRNVFFICSLLVFV